MKGQLTAWMKKILSAQEWLAEILPPFCTLSTSDHRPSIPHEDSPSTPSITLDSCIPAKASLDTLELSLLSSCPLPNPAWAIWLLLAAHT
jgi:hypothetical protein